PMRYTARPSTRYAHALCLDIHRDRRSSVFRNLAGPATYSVRAVGQDRDRATARPLCAGLLGKGLCQASRTAPGSFCTVSRRLGGTEYPRRRHEFLQATERWLGPAELRTQ